MDTKDLAAFSVVCEAGSIHAASKRIFITPQGLSQIIRRLENELGIDLFVRNKFGVRPTAYGEALYANARSIISELDNLKEGILRQGKHEKYTLNVASVIGVIQYLTVRFVKAFRETYPDVHLCIVENSDRAVKDRLNREEAEIGFLAGPIDTTVFRAIPFTKHRHCLVINKKHPLSRNSVISYKDLDKQPIALVGRDFAPYHNNRNRFLKASAEPDIVMEVTEIDLTHQIAQMGEGIGLSVDFPAWSNVYPDTVIRPFEDPDCIRETYIVYKNNRILSKAANDFMEFSQQWLKNHKRALFRWPAEYEALNDLYNS
jgi:DNA-binding transcriptional LysR family regulator